MDRSQPTAADTWDDEPIDRETFMELWDLLLAHPDYEVRPALQIHPSDSAMVKTIETLGYAEETRANLRHAVMFGEDGFEDLTDEQIDILVNHEFAVDSRAEVRDAKRVHVAESTDRSKPPAEGTKTRAVLEAFNPGEVVTCSDVADRVPESVGRYYDAGSMASFVSSLCNRGFVERTESPGKPQKYRLTDYGEEVVRGEF